MPSFPFSVSHSKDPGPDGSFSWKGFNWEKRFWGGAPQYNTLFDAANVSNPDANGYVTLKLTNPTGEAPVGAEFQSTRLVNKFKGGKTTTHRVCDTAGCSSVLSVVT